MPSYKKLISDLKDVLSGLYLKYGSEEEVVVLSQILDEFIVERQKSSLDLINIQKRITEMIGNMSEIMFEVDITNNRILYSKNDIIKNLNLDIENIYSYILNEISMYIHEDEFEEFRETFCLESLRKKLDNGEEKIVFECRMFIKGENKWMLYTAEPSIDEEDKSFTILIYAKDITEIKIDKIKNIKKEMPMDCLELHDNIYLEKEIEEYININGKNSNHALAIIDLKLKNSILDIGNNETSSLDIYNKIRKVFRTTDIVGIYGKNRFIALIKDIPSKNVVINKIEYLLRIFEPPININNSENFIDINIGVALCEENIKTFDELYKKARLSLDRYKYEKYNSYSISEKAEDILEREVDLELV